MISPLHTNTYIHTRHTCDFLRIALVLVFVWLSYRIYTFVNFVFDISSTYFQSFTCCWFSSTVSSGALIHSIYPTFMLIQPVHHCPSNCCRRRRRGWHYLHICISLCICLCDLITFSNCCTLRFMSTLLLAMLPLLPLGCLLDAGIMNWHVLHVREVSHFSTSAPLLLMAFVVVAIFIVIHLSKIRFHPSASILALPVYKHCLLVYYFCYFCYFC